MVDYTNALPELPPGWFLAKAEHSHNRIVFKGDTHQPLPDADGAWLVEIQHTTGGRLSAGRGRSLQEAAFKAIASRREPEPEPAPEPEAVPEAPKWWLPSAALRLHFEHYEKVKADYEAEDGDRRGVAAALTAAEYQVVAHVMLPPCHDEDQPDAWLVDLAAKAVIPAVRRALKERGYVSAG